MHSLSVRLALVALAVVLGMDLGIGGGARAGAEPLRIAQAGAGGAGAEEDADAGGATAPPGEPAPSRPATPTPRGDIEEIVVQAGESDAVADLDASDSVTGFDASDLEALGAQSIEDLAGFTPNLEIVTAGATTPTFFIRGVGLNDFNPNSSGAVAIYTDDVPKNSPALQLGTLFDVEAVTILRGPQGTGPFRSASAGAIKVYSRKPSGEFGGYLRSEIGNYDFRDFEGAVEMPIFEDVLSGRFSFRLSERDGYATNRCGGVPPAIFGTKGDREVDKFVAVGRPQYFNIRNDPGLIQPNINTDLISAITPQVADQVFQATNRRITQGYAYCGERVPRGPGAELDANGVPQIIDRMTPGNPALLVPDGLPDQNGFLDPFTGQVGTGVSPIPANLPEKINDLGNWATRGILRFQPTLDQDWLLTGHLAKRNEYSRLGQAYGTGQGNGQDHYVCDLDKPVPERDAACKFDQTLGSDDGAAYQPIEVIRALFPRNPCTFNFPTRSIGTVTGIIDPSAMCDSLTVTNAINAAVIEGGNQLVGMDDEPYKGDYDRVGRTKNDVWGLSLVGEIALGDAMQLKTVTGYDSYDRYVDTDLDFSPNTLFEITTKDEGWQFVQDMEFSGSVSQELPVGWNMGAFMLYEELKAPDVTLHFPAQTAAVATIERNWQQDLLSLAAYAGFDFDFWDDFTLDGGVRYNWERKAIDLEALANADLDTGQPGRQFSRSNVWQNPTGMLRLTYRFREDTQAYWKYTRGWKGGHYNVTANQLRGITSAEPEKIDSFEVGLRGSWFNGRLSLDTSLFHYAYQNYQIFTVQIPLLGNPEFVVLNASDAEVYGGEADLVARPLPGMFMQARFSWLESRFIEFVRTQGVSLVEGDRRNDIVTEIDSSGNRLLNSPQFKVSLTVEQTLPLGRFGSLTGRWDGAWTDDTYYDPTEGRGAGDQNGQLFLPPNTIGQSAYWLHNFRLDYRTPDGNVTIGAWVRNATDEVYKTFAFDASPLAVNRTTIYFLGVPRTYGGSLTVTF